MNESPRAADRAPRLARWIATGFGAGYAPVAPGTVGTLVAVPLYLAASHLPLAAYVALVVLMWWLGVWASEHMVRDLGDRDPQCIVWDEVTGYFVAMTAAPPGWGWMVAGFAAFRLFDIAKPWPVGWLDARIAGGHGVMADDLAAGAYALAVLQALAWIPG